MTGRSRLDAAAAKLIDDMEATLDELVAVRPHWPPELTRAAYDALHVGDFRAFNVALVKLSALK